MDSKKVTIIALVVLAVIYIGGVTTNLTKSDDSDNNDANSFDMDKNKWVGRMQDLFSGFNDKLNKKRIKPTLCKILDNNKKNPKTGTQNYLLSIASECKILLTKQKKADMQELIISVQESISVFRPCGESEKPTNRGLKPQFNTTLYSMNFQALSVKKNRSNLKAKKQANINNRRRRNKIPAATLAITYKPSDSDSSSGPAVCRAKIPYKIPIFEAGGQLILKCTGCTTQKTINVSFGETDT